MRPIRHFARVVRSVVREHVTKRRKRSREWQYVRREHIKRQPRCQACGGTFLLQVHHIIPFHLRPELELNPSNLITLCMGKKECHVNLGHGDDYQAFNPDVVKHAAHVKEHPDDWDLIDRWAHQNRRYTEK